QVYLILGAPGLNRCTRFFSGPGPVFTLLPLSAVFPGLFFVLGWRKMGPWHQSSNHTGSPFDVALLEPVLEDGVCEWSHIFASSHITQSTCPAPPWLFEEALWLSTEALRRTTRDRRDLDCDFETILRFWAEIPTVPSLLRVLLSLGLASLAAAQNFGHQISSRKGNASSLSSSSRCKCLEVLETWDHLRSVSLVAHVYVCSILRASIFESQTSQKEKLPRNYSETTPPKDRRVSDPSPISPSFSTALDQDRKDVPLHKILLAPANVATPKVSGPRRFMQQRQGEVALAITSRIDARQQRVVYTPQSSPRFAFLAALARTFEDGGDSDSEYEHDNGHDNDNGSESELSFEFDVLSSVAGAKISAHGSLVHSRLRNMHGAAQLQYPASSKRTSKAIAMDDKASSATYIPTHNSTRGVVDRYVPHTPHA
ncbi:hypothetical protein B0H14DRAFT_3564549, partial [Mycena olivaceomarginata]